MSWAALHGGRSAAERRILAEPRGPPARRPPHHPRRVPGQHHDGCAGVPGDGSADPADFENEDPSAVPLLRGRDQYPQEIEMAESIVIVGAKRTPIGSMQGKFNSVTASQLGAVAIK